MIRPPDRYHISCEGDGVATQGCGVLGTGRTKIAALLAFDQLAERHCPHGVTILYDICQGKIVGRRDLFWTSCPPANCRCAIPDNNLGRVVATSSALAERARGAFSGPASKDPCRAPLASGSQKPGGCNPKSATRPAFLQSRIQGIQSQQGRRLCGPGESKGPARNHTSKKYGSMHPAAATGIKRGIVDVIDTVSPGGGTAIAPAGNEKRERMETEITLTIKVVPGGFAVNGADGKLIAVSATPAALAHSVKAWAEGRAKTS